MIPKKHKKSISESQPAAFVFQPGNQVTGFDLVTTRQPICPVKLSEVKCHRGLICFWRLSCFPGFRSPVMPLVLSSACPLILFLAAGLILRVKSWHPGIMAVEVNPARAHWFPGPRSCPWFYPLPVLYSSTMGIKNYRPFSKMFVNLCFWERKEKLNHVFANGCIFQHSKRN